MDQLNCFPCCGLTAAGGCLHFRKLVVIVLICIAGGSIMFLFAFQAGGSMFLSAFQEKKDFKSADLSPDPSPEYPCITIPEIAGPKQKSKNVQQQRSKTKVLANLNNIPGFHNTTLTHVVMAFNPAQIHIVEETLKEWWSKYPPCEVDDFQVLADQRYAINIDQTRTYRKPRLVFMMSRRKNDEESEETALENDDELRELVTPKLQLQSSSASCFSDVSICITRLRKSEDKHKTGSRLFNERMLRGICVRGRRGYGIYIEPDVRPVRKNWLSILATVLTFPAPPSWVIGSFNRGDFPFTGTRYLPNLFHMNGNAIYRLTSDPKSDDFEDESKLDIVPDKRERTIRRGSYAHFYIHSVRPYIIKKHGATADTAYDTDVYEFLWDYKNYDSLRHYFVHNVRFKDLILNMYESSWSMSKIHSLSSNAVLVHGGFPDENYLP